MTQSTTHPSNSNKERVSALGSNASVTVEAALIIPLFLFAVISLIYMLEIQAIKTSIKGATQCAAKMAAQDAVKLQSVNSVKFKQDLAEAAGADRLNRSIIAGGSKGIDCSRTYMSVLTGEINVVVEYSIKLPFPGFTHLTAKFREKMRIKGWTGYSKRNGHSGDEQIVYITAKGRVYHENYQCTHLQLSVRFVPYSELSGIRNEDGGRYGKCEKCVHGEPFAGVYITNTGGKYHNSLGCSGLKRTVHAVKKSQVGMRGGCSRCSSWQE